MRMPTRLRNGEGCTDREEAGAGARNSATNKHLNRSTGVVSTTCREGGLGQWGRHTLVCFPAYLLWKTLAQTCRTAGLGDEPRPVFEEFSKVTLVDVALPTRAGVTIRKRCVSRPPSIRRFYYSDLG